MLRRHWNPAGIAAPFGRYRHAVLIERSSKLLVLSGLLGVHADGTIPRSLEEQARVIFDSIDLCLADAGLDRSHLVRLSTFLTEADDRLAFMRIRDTWVPDPPPASTLIIVKALALPEYKIEIEALAAA